MKKILMFFVAFALSINLCGCYSSYELREAATPNPTSGTAVQKDVTQESYNPYFPYGEETEEEYSCCEELVINGKVKWMTKLVESSSKGMLYQAGFDRIYSRNSDDDYEIFDGKETKVMDYRIYFWVTRDKIYYVNEINNKQRTALLNKGKLPSGTLTVCQEEEKEDTLRESEVGRHELMEQHKEDIICYRSWSINNKNNPEGRACFQLVWKKGVGLIGYRYADSVAGGGSILIWNQEYLERQDVGFNM